MDYDDEKDQRGCLRLSVDEVFYLSKEEENRIFISQKQTFKLRRHQHRGLRFLYRQFKLKKPGVIMNDASGFGKKVQTAVFLDAIKHTLSQPALIMCNDIERDSWKYYFMHFGRDYKETLSFDASLPSADKKVFIRSFDDIETLVKKSWSIVVVDDPVAIKWFKPLKNLKAAFRIWVVSIELKYNLNTFAAINDWINPNNTFSIQDFTPKNKTVGEIIEKAVLLDRYFEELVLSRGHEDKKDKKKQTYETNASKIKKNKDPTGTKTKKSKTSTTITNPIKNKEDINNSKAGTCQKANKNAKISWESTKASYSSDESCEEPVASKRKKKNKATSHPEAEDYRNEMFFNFVDSDDDDPKDTWQNVNKRLTENHAKSNIIPDRRVKHAASKTNLSKDVHNQSEETSKSKENDNNDKLSNDSIAYDLNTIQMEDNVKNESIENTVDDENLENSEIYKNVAKDEVTKSDEMVNKSNIAKNESNKIDEIANEIETNNPQNESTTSDTALPQAESSHSKMDESIIDTKIRNLEEKTFAQFKGSFLDQLLGTTKTLPKSVASCSNNSDTTVQKSKELVQKNDDLFNKSPKEINKVVETGKLTSPVKVANQSPSKASPKKIDDQIKELEQKAYNKFKGSLLDQLF